jgi:hypothetical protein
MRRSVREKRILVQLLVKLLLGVARPRAEGIVGEIPEAYMGKPQL